MFLDPFRNAMPNLANEPGIMMLQSKLKWVTH